MLIILFLSIFKDNYFDFMFFTYIFAIRNDY